MSQESNRELIQRGLDAVNAHDLGGFLLMTAPTYAIYDVRQPEPLVGPELVRAYFETLLAAFPDFALEEVSARSSGYLVYQEIIMRGTHKGPLPMPNGAELPPTGKRVNLRVEVIHRFDMAGRLASTVAYTSLEDLAAQLGVDVEQ